jgi:hypothetical protein
MRSAGTSRATALDYLLATLQNHLDLPRAYATLHPVKDGKTAHRLLLDQLELLDSKCRRSRTRCTARTPDG